MWLHCPRQFQMALCSNVNCITNNERGAKQTSIINESLSTVCLLWAKITEDIINLSKICRLSFRFIDACISLDLYLHS